MISTSADCPHCGRPDGAEPFEVVSRHDTARGRTVWARCRCGSLQVRVEDGRGTRVVSRGRPPERRPSPAGR